MSTERRNRTDNNWGEVKVYKSWNEKYGREVAKLIIEPEMYEYFGIPSGSRVRLRRSNAEGFFLELNPASDGISMSLNKNKNTNPEISQFLTGTIEAKKMRHALMGVDIPKGGLHFLYTRVASKNRLYLRQV